MPEESIYIKQHRHYIQGVLYRGTATDGSLTTLEDTSIPDTYDDDFWKDANLIIFGGTGVRQIKKISGYDKTTHTLTVYEAFTVAPAAGSLYQVVPGTGVSVGGGVYSDNNFSTSGVHDYTAAYPVFTIAQDTRFNLTGIAIDISVFTPGATITLQAQRATAASGVGYEDYGDPIYVVAGTDPDLVRIPDLTGMYSYTRITALSDNAGDSSVDVPFYWAKEDVE